MSVLLFVCSILSGCANAWHPLNAEDPYEDYNRKIFRFNLAVDRGIYRPVARAYDAIVPNVAQRGIKNILSNVNQLPVIANDFLQLNGPWIITDTARLLVNTTLGIAGLFDVATRMGFKKHSQDFGLTLAKWGVHDSHYFLFPFLPPSTARDFLGTGLDGYVLSPWQYVDPQWIGYTARGTDMVQTRAGLLSSDKWVDEAFDPYVFVRDFYLQNRKAKIQRVLHPEHEWDSMKNINDAQ